MLPLLRYTLDLFSALPAQPASAPLDLAGNTPAPVASMPYGPQQPAQQLDRAIAPVQLRHPRSNRESRIGEAVVAYELLRVKRRSIGFSIGPDGLVVRAPRWTPLYEVEAAVQSKGRWILTKLQETRERQQRNDSARMVWQDGAVMPFLGMPVQLVLDPAHGFRGRGAALQKAALQHTPQYREAGEPGQLRVGLAHNATAQQIRDAVQAWLMIQAHNNFQQRMEHFAPLLGVRWTRLRLSNAGTRWGSASADGSVRLNWRLIHFRQPVIDYVVAHELSHLRVMDHSPRFWDTVATVVPDYAQLRRQLKEDGMPRW